ncbi:Uncharacterised protein [Porphyromonas macacae]|uniref:Uncharacterized protein n=1 Tax=Porphyromonas macacae TaxID=28115 RepID=A0A379DK35_9PORP|nr:Uncharacterised protein [Porphyromonas macacae]
MKLTWGFPFYNETISKVRLGTSPFRCIRMRKVQGAKTEAEGNAPKYVTEAEGCK